MCIRTINLLSNHHMNATNRLKAVLVEQHHTNKRLADQLEKSENAVPR